MWDGAGAAKTTSFFLSGFRAAGLVQQCKHSESISDSIQFPSFVGLLRVKLPHPFCEIPARRLHPGRNLVAVDLEDGRLINVMPGRLH
jgi:hypothetical protein